MQPLLFLLSQTPQRENQDRRRGVEKIDAVLDSPERSRGLARTITGYLFFSKLFSAAATSRPRLAPETVFCSRSREFSRRPWASFKSALSLMIWGVIKTINSRCLFF